jgi:molybdopterin-guanine dinucleotide biosynthesis protein A
VQGFDKDLRQPRCWTAAIAANRDPCDLALQAERDYSAQADAQACVLESRIQDTDVPVSNMSERNDRLVPHALTRDAILGVILAGGASSRFGSDKGVANLDGRSLILRVTERAKPQVGQLALSGRNPTGVTEPVIPDMVPAEGPLTGIFSALYWARSGGYSAIATFSCDAPFFPMDLVARLAEGLEAQQSCRYVTSKGVRHPVFALWQVTSLPLIEQIYRGGERALKRTQDQIGGVPVEFPPGDGPGGEMFFNVNRKADLAIAEAWVRARH